MQKVICSIFSVEKLAGEMIENARKECEAIYQNMQKQKENIKCDIQERQAARLEKIKQYEEEHADAKLNLIAEQSRCALDKINYVYEKNKDVWVEEIYKKVIGR